jgi:hypothetical protein
LPRIYLSKNTLFTHLLVLIQSVSDPVTLARFLGSVDEESREMRKGAGTAEGPMEDDASSFLAAYSSTLKMGAVDSSETFLLFHQNKLSYIPEDSIIF